MEPPVDLLVGQDGDVDPYAGDDLDQLRRLLLDVRLPLETADAPEARELAAAAAGQLADYILPRLRAVDAPLLTVVAGSTGAGKSALVNSLVGHVVSRSGVLRPTTRQPVLVHHPDDLHWFADQRILPQLPRVTGSLTGAEAAHQGGPPALHLVADVRVPAGLALLDAPDIDSVSGSNRELAATLMAAADLWLFLTTAARYADAVPWSALRAAVARDAAVALVLNRVPPEALAEVTAHLRSLLAREGLADAPLFVIAEAPLRENLLDPASVAVVRRWIDGLGGDQAARAAVARRTVEGALGSLAIDVVRVAEASDRQVRAAARVREMAESSFSAGAARVAEIGADGSLLRGEVLARWQEFVGASALTAALETRMSRWRDAMGRAFRGRPVEPDQVVEVLETGVAAVLLDELGSAFERSESMWRDDPVGRQLVERHGLGAPPADAAAQAERLVRDWQADVLTLVRTEGADRRGSARALAYGVNGAALSLMVVVFSTTGGLTGAEVGIAGGSAVLAQKLLEAVFSEDAVRRMSATAKQRLAERVDTYFSEHARAFTGLLDDLGLTDADGVALRRLVTPILVARDHVAASGPPAVPSAPARPVRESDRPPLRARMRDWWAGR